MEEGSEEMDGVMESSGNNEGYDWACLLPWADFSSAQRSPEGGLEKRKLSESTGGVHVSPWVH